jgi:hypothetical protein
LFGHMRKITDIGTYAPPSRPPEPSEGLTRMWVEELLKVVC